MILSERSQFHLPLTFMSPLRMNCYNFGDLLTFHLAVNITLYCRFTAPSTAMDMCMTWLFSLVKITFSQRLRALQMRFHSAKMHRHEGRDLKGEYIKTKAVIATKSFNISTSRQCLMGHTSLVIYPSLLISYRLKAQLSFSWIVPRRRIERPMTKSCNENEIHNCTNTHTQTSFLETRTWRFMR